MSALGTTRSSATGTTTQGHGPAGVLVVVGLLMAVTLLAWMVARQRRPRGLLLRRRHQYREVEATATRMNV